MKYTLLLAIFISNGSYGQSRAYFTKYFQSRSDDTTKNVRVYDLVDGEYLIEDYQDGKITMKGTFVGVLYDKEGVDAFIWHYTNRGYETNQLYPNGVGRLSRYDSAGQITERMILKGGVTYYEQVWDSTHQPLLKQGSGKRALYDAPNNEDRVEMFKDSILVSQYGIRHEYQDTIFYKYDEPAIPYEGIESFYNRFTKIMRYPLVANLNRKEGTVYVQFVVDKTGALTDFKPLSDLGFNLEKKTIKKLKKLPAWKPAVYEERLVKTKYVMPVTFKLQ